MTTSVDWRQDALSWVGRKVRIVEGPSAESGIQEVGAVICVDATDYRPSAWVKIGDLSERGCSYASYRSCDLCWLEDIETGEGGPVWCAPPGRKGHAKNDGEVIAERIASITPGNGE